MVRYVLHAQGYRVTEAINGQEALTIARTEQPDLILMDLSMPVLDGFGATRELRRITDLCDVPIIAVSAHNSTDHRAKALDVGFNDYLTKPVDFTHMIELIRRLLRDV